MNRQHYSDFQADLLQTGVEPYHQCSELNNKLHLVFPLFSVGRGRQCYTTKCNALVNSQFTVAVILPLSQVTFHFLNALTNLITDNFHAPNVSAHVKKTRIIIFFFNVFVFRFHLLSYFLWLLWQNYRKITLILFVGSFMLHRTWMDTFVITKYS